MAKSNTARGEGNDAAPHEKAARRVKQLKSGASVLSRLIALLWLSYILAVAPFGYFLAKEKIADVLASDEQISDRAFAEMDDLLRNTFSLAGLPTASIPMAMFAYYGYLYFGLMPLGGLYFQRDRTARAARDQEVEYALLALRAGARPSRMIGCFLRSFRLDDIFGEREPTLTEQASRRRYAWRRGGRSLEQSLSSAFAALPERPIVCSVERRKPGSAFGRIETSDAEWRSVVSTLMDEADFFVLIFGQSAGTTWELDELSKKGLIDRTLFVIPDPVELKSQSALDAYQLEKEYTQLFSALSKMGYTLPKFYEEGSAFCFKDKQAVSIYQNNKIRKRAVSSFIAGLPPRRAVALHAELAT